MAVNLDNTNAGTFTLKPPATGGAISLTLPTSAGTAGQGLSTNASGILSFAAPSFTGFTTAINSASPNYVTSVSASGGTTNQDLALVQKTTSSPLLMLAVPDGTTAGGNARGANSVDLVLGTRVNANSVAGGTNSILIGGNGGAGAATASFNVIQIGAFDNVTTPVQNPDTYGIPINLGGQNLNRTGQSYGATSDEGWFLALPGFTINGTAQPNQGRYNIVGPGSGVQLTSSFSHVFSSERINSTDFNSNASRRVLLMARTTNATTRQMTTDGAAATGTALTSIMFNNANSAGVLEIKIIAVQELVSGTGDSACWQIQGTFYKNATAGTSTINENLNNKTFSSGGASAWTASLVADTATGFPAVNVTGAAAVTIRWMAYVLMAEVTAYA